MKVDTKVEKAIKIIKAKLERNDNPILTPGLIYALTVLEHDINPLRKRVYDRLEKMELKDLADKINELKDELNRIKTIR